MDAIDTRTIHWLPPLTMSRYWFLTWTTYGTWLPGDERGSVTSIRKGEAPRFEHDQPGMDYDGHMPGLQDSALRALKQPPIYLNLEHATLLLMQFHETASIRRWSLLGVAIMANHLHMIVGVPDDPDPEKLVRDFKSYGSGALNRRFGKPECGTWWAKGGGSRRKLHVDQSVAERLIYLRDQQYPLIVWFADGFAPPNNGVS